MSVYLRARYGVRMDLLARMVRETQPATKSAQRRLVDRWARKAEQPIPPYDRRQLRQVVAELTRGERPLETHKTDEASS